MSDTNKVDAAEVSPQEEIYGRIIAAKRVSTPVIGLVTNDAIVAATNIYALIRQSSSKALRECMVLQWDIERGITAMGTASQQILDALLEDESVSTEELRAPETALKLAKKFPENSTFFFHNADKFIHDIIVSQAVENIRDVYKANCRTLVLLGPEIVLPSNLQENVLMFDEPLPSRDQLRRIMLKEVDVAAEHYKNFTKPEEHEVERSVDALQGLNLFAAEQVTALSMNPRGMDGPTLWLRKKQLIESTPGLSVIDDARETFDTIGGLHNIKTFMTKLVNGKNPPQALVFIDEIEKMLGGSSGDTSGVSQGFLGSLLTYMQDNNATGIILVSPPGCGKSAIAKAAGKQAGVPTIMLDLNGMKGSLVGESEQNLRRSLKVVTAVSNKNAFFIATCNSLASLPPELRRRFTFGTYFFDLPDAEEREMIWNIYVANFGLDPNQEIPNSEGWSGANIHDCCHAAYRLNCTIAEAVQYIVPISKAATEEIAALRKQANGRFLSASKPGIYVMPAAKKETASSSKKGRSYNFLND